MFNPTFGGPRSKLLLEVIMVLCVFLTVLTLIVQKARDAMARAEDSQIVATVNNLSAALMQEALAHLIRGEYAMIADMQSMNPMRLAAPNLPSNYRGELTAAQAREVPAGNWFFDQQQARLVYRIAYDFAKQRRGVEDLIVRVSLRYRDRNENQVFDPGVDAFTTIGLVTD